MRLRRREFMSIAASAAALPLSARVARAQSYPSRPVRVVVPFAPGGPTDIFARIITQKLSERFGRQFYVDNVAGATGNIGTAQVGQGPISYHSEEHLTTTDKGVGMCRRMLAQQIKIVQEGGDPLGVNFDPAQQVVVLEAGNFFQ